jgi:UDP-N-acetylglucosamine 2-epimerase (non-hydrolysing)/GDP/UDP-N,N'-diacetylbacillosamine 2-epimerase (hydrolysing)
MKILALTSIRSEYDLLSSLYKLLDKDNDIEFKVLVSGAHLSSEHGYTKQYIENDGFDILLEIETLINGDSHKSKLKTASIFLQNSIDIVAQFNPEVILYAGDREDVIMGGLLGTYLHIPTIHFYGGDHEAGGHEDTVIRHATSKLSTYHFVSNEEHSHRLMKMGETESRIFNVGSISLDRFSDYDAFSIETIFSKLNLPNIDKIALLIYHPSPSIEDDDRYVFENILKSLEDENIFTFVSYPNTDSNSSEIIKIIEKYQNSSTFYFFKNLERELFLSIFKRSQFIIGNSSAGIYEAASIPIPAINVGKRQKDRMAGKNVRFCETSIQDIRKTIQEVTSLEFLKDIQNMINPYGDGNSAIRAYKLIKSIKLNKLLQKIEDPLC